MTRLKPFKTLSFKHLYIELKWRTFESYTACIYCVVILRCYIYAMRVVHISIHMCLC